jgi:hypothetical protein
MTTQVRPRERDAIIQALRSGVVPRTGQHLIQVGRKNEIEALLKDLDRIADGGTAFRLLIGDYGSGKTFLLNLVRSLAFQKKLVTASADLNPDRRLHGGGGQTRSLYAELAKNMSTLTKQDGGALPGIVEKFIYNAETEAKTKRVDVEATIRQRLERLSEMVNGFDFAHVVSQYWRAHKDGNQELKNSALRWLRGEFTTKTDARNALGVRTFVDDASAYDQIKLLALFVRLAGFSGLLVCLDELVNLYRVASAPARTANYEQLLRMLNDTNQGTDKGLGFFLSGTPEFLQDTRRGLFSYDALQSRLAENAFAKAAGVADYTHPVLRLSSLTPSDFFVLLERLRDVYAYGDQSRWLLQNDALEAFMRHCHSKVGDAYFRTPRTTITAFLNLLAVLDQNPEIDWRNLLDGVQVEKDNGANLEMATDIPEPASPALSPSNETDDDELTTLHV